MSFTLIINAPKYQEPSIEHRDEAGRLHCVDGPALVAPDREIWCIHGKLHRLDGPAIVDHAAKVQAYRVNGLLHREDGPARTWYPGHRGRWGKPQLLQVDEFWLMGRRHRLDGPAIVTSAGGKAYYIENRQMSEIEFLIVTDRMTEEQAEDILRQDLGKRDRKLLTRYLARRG